MSLRFVLLGTVLAGCGFQISTSGSGAQDAADGPGGDGTVADGDPPVDATPDAPPIDARICPPAPDDCIAFTCPSSPSCYFVCSGKQNWNSARDHCNTASGCLATIGDAAEDACINQHTLPVFPDIVWFGFKQTGNVEPAGGWGWQCGTSAYQAPNWGAFEPNDSGGNEDCGALSTGGAWLDGACNTTARYVCEIE